MTDIQILIMNKNKESAMNKLVNLFQKVLTENPEKTVKGMEK